MRCLGDHKDIPLRPNTIIRVVNTFLYSGHFWLAWIVDENGTDCELRKIPSPSKYDCKFDTLSHANIFSFTMVNGDDNDYCSILGHSFFSVFFLQSQAAVWQRRLRRSGAPINVSLALGQLSPPTAHCSLTDSTAASIYTTNLHGCVLRSLAHSHSPHTHTHTHSSLPSLY